MAIHSLYTGETNHSLSGMNLQVEVGERFAKMVLDVLESYPSYTKILQIPLCWRVLPTHKVFGRLGISYMM